jgi:hypothetical protein
VSDTLLLESAACQAGVVYNSNSNNSNICVVYQAGAEYDSKGDMAISWCGVYMYQACIVPRMLAGDH